MESAIVKFLNQWRSDWINYVAVFISEELFLVILWTSITFIILFSDKRNGKKVSIAVIVALILHFSISEGLIKNFLGGYFLRIRPYLADGNIFPIGKQYADSSFPSSHMASTLAVLSVYFHYYRKCWFAMAFFVLLMAFARMHNGMHYPSDILAGLILGIVYGAVSVYFANKILD